MRGKRARPVCACACVCQCVVSVLTFSYLVCASSLVCVHQCMVCASVCGLCACVCMYDSFFSFLTHIDQVKSAVWWATWDHVVPQTYTPWLALHGGMGAID